MCRQCSLKPVYVFTNKRQVCKGCFIRWFQAKVFYTLKKFGMSKKGDVIGYKSGRGFRDAVLRDVLMIYESRAPVDVVKMPNKKVNRIAISITTDIESSKIIEGLIKDNLKKLRVGPVERNVIKPLYLFLDKEVMLYAKLKKLKFTKKHAKKTKFFIIIDNLEKRHPEIKHAILNSYLKIFN